MAGEGKSEPNATRPGGGVALVPWLLMMPALLLVIVFFTVPLATMFRMSFNEWIPPKLYTEGFTFDHYARLVRDNVFRAAIMNTVVLALVASCVTVCISYTFAMLVWLKPSRWRLMFIALALCPLLISEIAVIFGWWMFFPKNGLLSYALYGAGLVTEKTSLMYTEFAALVGLVYINIAFCFFIMLSIFDGTDKRLLDASADLGATPFTTFRRVLLPVTWIGVVAAFSQAFIWSMGIYATPTALGPNNLWTIGFLIQEQMLGKSNWPMASAFSIFLAVVVALVIVTLRLLSPKKTNLHG